MKRLNVTGSVPFSLLLLGAPHPPRCDLELPVGGLGRRVAPVWYEAVAVDDSGGDVDQLTVGAARVVAQHVEGSRLVHRVAFHEDALRPLGGGPAPERALEVAVLGEAAQDDQVFQALALIGRAFRFKL